MTAGARSVGGDRMAAICQGIRRAIIEGALMPGDRLPEDALPGVAEYLATVAGSLLRDLPPEDEELSPEEQAMIDASRAAIARGDVVRHEDLLARRTARRGQT